MGVYEVGAALAADPLSAQDATVFIDDAAVLRRLTERFISKMKGLNRRELETPSKLEYGCVGRGLSKNSTITSDLLMALYKVIVQRIWIRYGGLDGDPDAIRMLFNILENKNCPVEVIRGIINSEMPKYVWARAVANTNATIELLERALAYTTSPYVRAAIARNSNVSERILLRLACSADPIVIEGVASSPNITDEVIELLMRNQSSRDNRIFRSLLDNPRVPVTAKHNIINRALNSLKAARMYHGNLSFINEELLIGSIMSRSFTYKYLRDLLQYIPYLRSYGTRKKIAQALVSNLYVDDEFIVEFSFCVGSDIARDLILGRRCSQTARATQQQSVIVNVPKDVLEELGRRFSEDPFDMEHYIASAVDHSLLRTWFSYLMHNTCLCNMPRMSDFAILLLSNPALPKALGPDAGELLYKFTQAYNGKREIAATILNNKNTPGELLRRVLFNEVEQNNGMGSILFRAAAANPGIDKDLCRWLAGSKSTYVRQALASNPATPRDVLERLMKSSVAAIRDTAAARLTPHGKGAHVCV